MSRCKSSNPRDRLGVFKALEDVPASHRLERYEQRYSDRNVWKTFCEEQEYEQGSSARFRETVDRVGSHWIDHVESRGRHPALAAPGHVESWCRRLLEDKAARTAYNYWVRIRRFYDWLLWHVEHPHVYNPVLLAVVDGGAAGDIWDVMVRKWEDVRSKGASHE